MSKLPGGEHIINIMRVSVEYFDDEPREPLRLSEEQWRIMAHPQPKAASRAGSAGDKFVKEQKRHAAQDELAKVRLEEDEPEKCF